MEAANTANFITITRTINLINNSHQCNAMMVLCQQIWDLVLNKIICSKIVFVQLFLVPYNVQPLSAFIMVGLGIFTGT